MIHADAKTLLGDRGHRVTTHCMLARDLQNLFPKCLVDAGRIFINDGPTWTSACMSPGQFSRVFQAEIGQSPTKAIENLCVEAARILMERTRHSIDTVADRNRMRRAFGQPLLIRRRTAHGDFGVEKVGFDALTTES